MVKEPIIPEAASKRRFLLIPRWNISFADVAVLIFFSGIGILIAWNAWNTQRVIGILCAVIFLAFGIALNITHGEYRKKYYEIFFIGFIYRFITKKFKYGEKNDTKNLIPYTKIEGDYIVIGEGKNIRYLSALRVIGNNFYDYEDYTQDDILEKITEIYKRFNLGGAILIIDQIRTRKEHIFKIEERKEKLINRLKKGEITDKQYFSRTKKLDEELDHYNNDLKNYTAGDEKYIEKAVYVIFYAVTIDAIKQLESFAYEEFKRAKVLPLKLTAAEKVNMLTKMIDHNIVDANENHILSYKNKLDEYFAPHEINFKSNYFNFGPKNYFSVTSIKDYPFNPEMGWIDRLSTLTDPVIIKFHPISEENFQSTLYKATVNAKNDLEGTGKKEILSAKRKERNLERFTEFIDAIGAERGELFKMNTYILHKGSSSREISAKKKQTNKILKTIQMTQFVHPYRQFEAFSSILLKPSDPLLDETGREIPIFTLAWGTPFINNELNDVNGWKLGSTTLGHDVFYDPHARDKERRNSNVFLLATSGSGKSITVQKMIINELINGNKLYVIDPEDEYTNLALYFGENVISLGNGNSKLNPLQIFPSISDIDWEDKEKKEKFELDFWKNDVKLTSTHLLPNEKLINKHKEEIIGKLFEIFCPDINEEGLRYIKDKFWWFYIDWMQKKDKENRDILEWNNDEFPIFQDFYNWLIINVEQKTNKINFYEIFIDILEEQFVDTKNKIGSYSMFYNGHTSIEIGNRDLTVFNISELVDSKDKKILNMQFILLMMLINRQIKIVEKLEPNIVQRVIVDEAHVLLDQKFPIALDAIYKMVKMIRKRNGGITIVTQNPEDFVSDPTILKQTKAIITNSQSAMFLSLTRDNIEKAEELFSGEGGFTNREKSQLEKAEVGEGLLVVSKSRRYLLKVDMPKEDFDAIKDQEMDLLEYVKENIVIRLVNVIGQLENLKTITLDDLELVNKNDEELIVTLHLKENHNIKEIMFHRNIELDSVILESEKLVLKFNKSHFNTANTFVDRIKEKIIAYNDYSQEMEEVEIDDENEIEESNI